MPAYLGLQYGHDATAALLVDGRLAAVVSEERLSRLKHHWGLPERAIREVLRIAGVEPREVDVLACSGRVPWVQVPGEVVLGDGTVLPPRGPNPLLRLKKRVGDVVKRRKDWANQLREIGLRPRRTFFVEHHLCHAASAHYTSGFEQSLCLTIDGHGDEVSASVSLGRGESLQRVDTCGRASSLGSFYQAITEALGFAPIEGENKTMGLGCFGDPERFLPELRSWVWCDEQGRLRTREPWRYRSIDVYGTPYPGIAQAEAFARLLKNEDDRRDLAAAAQRVTEEAIVAFVAAARRRQGESLPVCAAGGVMLNVKANQLVHERLGVESFWVFPDAGDAGTALGAALYARRVCEGAAALGRLGSPYLGNEAGEGEIESELRRHGDRLRWERPADFLGAVTDLLEAGRVVGWFQGRMEMGPRALGARSVLADPRQAGVKDRINRHLKKRDWFVPFAPSGLDGGFSAILEHYRSEPFMTKAFTVRPEYRGRLPAITHVDGTARPQGVVKETNPLYHALLERVEQRWGLPVVLNTSFNRHGLPIVCKPPEAVQHLLDGNVEALAIGPFVVTAPGAFA